MPELPDVELYVEALRERVLGRRLEACRLKSAFLLRSAVPPLSEASGRSVEAIGRQGKRIVIELGPGARPGGPPWLALVLHLMIAGRLHWRERGAALARRTDLAAFDFEGGTLLLSEAGTKKRAALHVVGERAGLAALDRGGLEPLTADRAAFAERLGTARHTLKRALCDPRILSGIGNAYSDEILHAARLSPVALTSRLSDGEVERLRVAIVATLAHWTGILRREAGDGFPRKVTAFRDGMAVHGRYGKPCPDCGSPVQRIRYADNECNYCVTCQCGGRLLADRGLSTLLKKDWPKTLEELEERRRPG